MNRRAIAPIIEQFLIFAMGVFLFSMVVVIFRGMEQEYLDKTAVFSVQLAGEYASFSMMNAYELKSIGKNPRVETTAAIPHASEKSRYYLTLRDSNMTVISSSKTATVSFPAKVSAEGNAYTTETITFTYSGGKINLNGGSFD